MLGLGFVPFFAEWFLHALPRPHCMLFAPGPSLHVASNSRMPPPPPWEPLSVLLVAFSADCFPLDFDVVVDSHSEPGTGGPSLPPKKRNFSDVGLAGRAPCEDKVHLWLASAAPLQGRRNSEPQTSDQRPASRDVSPDPGSDAIR